MSSTPTSSSLKTLFSKYIGHGHFNDRGFLEGVGLHLEEAEHIFELCEPFLNKASAHRDFLLALNFLKEYRHEQIAAFQFDILSTSTYENSLWETLEQLNKALPKVHGFCELGFNAALTQFV